MEHLTLRNIFLFSLMGTRVTHSQPPDDVTIDFIAQDSFTEAEIRREFRGQMPGVSLYPGAVMAMACPPRPPL